jgi:hypothetical protein
MVDAGIGPSILRIRHIRNVERLASFRQRDPRIPQAYIMFALLGIVCFLRQRGAPGRRFPCGLALGPHLVTSISTTSPPASTILLPLRIYCELVSLTFRRGRKDRGARLPLNGGRKMGHCAGAFVPRSYLSPFFSCAAGCRRIQCDEIWSYHARTICSIIFDC